MEIQAMKHTDLCTTVYEWSLGYTGIFHFDYNGFSVQTVIRNMHGWSGYS